MKLAMFSTLLLVISVSHGVVGQECVTTRGITYDNCVEIGPIDVFWNMIDQQSTEVEMLYEASDEGWRGVGFSSQRGATAMANSNVVIGCTESITPDAEGADFYLASRTPGDQTPEGRQMLSLYAVNQTNGICSVQFTRPVSPVGLDINNPDNDELQSLTNGLSRMIAANGGPILGQHLANGNARQLMDIDFTISRQDPITPPVPAQVETPCTTTSGQMYDNCVEIGPFDVFWNMITVDSLNIEMAYEMSDAGWRGLGFSGQRGDAAMANSNAVMGCIDAIAATPEGADFFLESRAGGGQNPEGRQGLLEYTVNQANGICTVAFTRPVSPVGVDAVNDTAQSVVSGLSRVIVAFGGPQLGAHATDARTFMDIDLTVSRQDPITPPPVTEAPGQTAGPDDNSASVLNAWTTMLVATVLATFVGFL